MVEDATQTAKELLYAWLVEQFHDAPIDQIISDDPVCQLLTDEDYERVLDAMLSIKLVSVHLQ